MASILGLLSNNDLNTRWSENVRRTVLYQYPNGGAPLTGLLSLADTMSSDKPIYGGWEKRYNDPVTQTASADAQQPTAGVVFYATSGGVPTGAGLLNNTDTDTTTTYAAYVDDSTKFRPNDFILFHDLEDDGSTGKVYARVEDRGDATDVDSQTSTGSWITFKFMTDLSALGNKASQNEDKWITNLGGKFAEGATAQTGSYKRPIETKNAMQIFRTAFEITGSALKAGMRYDADGSYGDLALDNALVHSVTMESAMLFGAYENTTTTSQRGTTVPIRSTGGVEWYLEQWEAEDGGSVADGGNGYRNGEAAATANTDENKRIIDLSDADTDIDTFLDYMERAWRKSSDSSYEKLMLCGSTFLAKFNKMVRQKSLITHRLNPDSESYGMNITAWESPFGMVYLQMHPLMAERTYLRDNAFMLDVGNLHYIHLNDRDTELYQNRQAPDEDLILDEWLTEAGLWLDFPESHMYFKNVGNLI